MNPKLSLFVALLAIGRIGSSKQNFASAQNCDCSSQSGQDNTSKLYVFGGLKYIFGDQHPSNEVSCLNSATDEWKFTRNSLEMSQAKACGAIFDNKIYLIGGLTQHYENRSEKVKVNVEVNVYDHSTDTYTMLRPMPTARQSCGAAALKNSVYVAGGSTNASLIELDDPESLSLSSMIRYDIGTNKWSTMKSMSTARNGLHLVELGGLLYAIGGDAGKTVEVYNPATDQWSFGASTNYVHRWFGATAYEGKIYAYSDSGFEVYAPDTNQWTVLDVPNWANGWVYGMRPLVEMNSKLWAVSGGARRVKGTDSFYQTALVHSYDPATGLWTKQHDIDRPPSHRDRMYHTAFAINC